MAEKKAYPLPHLPSGPGSEAQDFLDCRGFLPASLLRNQSHMNTRVATDSCS